MEKSVVASSLPACFSAITSAVATSGMYERPSSIAWIFARIEVDAGRVESRLGELHGERQADIAEPDDAGAGAAGLNLFQKGGGQR